MHNAWPDPFSWFGDHQKQREVAMNITYTDISVAMGSFVGLYLIVFNKHFIRLAIQQRRMLGMEASAKASEDHEAFGRIFTICTGLLFLVVGILYFLGIINFR